MKRLPLEDSSQARLQALYEANHAAVAGVLRRFGLDSSRAADVSQQVFLVALERLEDFREGKDRAFLCAIAARLARTACRPDREELCELVPEVDSNCRPDDELERLRLGRLLGGLLAELKDELRTVLWLAHVEGCTKRELAQRLHIPEGTAASRLRRARRAFGEAHAAARCA